MPSAPSIAATDLEVEYLQGIHVADSVLWLDAPRSIGLCFVSHAHLDEPLLHRKILTTDATASLIRDRVGKGITLVSPYYRRFALGSLDLEMFPAGHVLGAAQIRVRRGQRRLVYTGHFSFAAQRTCQPALVLEADILIMEATYGLPYQVFPPRAEVEQALVDWTRQVLAQGQTPVLFASVLGKAQELCALLAQNGLKVRAHRLIHQMTDRYRRLGVNLPAMSQLRTGSQSTEPVLFPFHLRGSKILQQLGPIRTAVASGKAMEPEAKGLLNVDVSFPLSGHADARELRAYALESGAKKILLLGAAAPFLAQELREQGANAWPIRPLEQLELFSK